MPEPIVRDAVYAALDPVGAWAGEGFERGIATARVMDALARYKFGRLPCGCPDVDPLDVECDVCVWSHWHLSPIDALREDRFCLYCGAMDTRRLVSDPQGETR